MIRPIDVFVLLKLVARGKQPWGQVEIANELGISQSSVNEALKKAFAVGLYSPDRKRVNSLALQDALAHGARYFMGPMVGGLVRGMPTASFGPVINAHLAPTQEPPFVWPDAEGVVRGISVQPIHPSAPNASRKDPVLYDLLTILDTFRLGSARERELAKQELTRILSTS